MKIIKITKLKFTIFLPLILFLTSCADDKKQEKLSFPTLDVCSQQLLDSDSSFMCIEEETRNIQVNIKFASYSFALRDNAKKTLDELYAFLRLTKEQPFTIKGYASKTESSLLKDSDHLITKQNIELSQARASSVKTYLVQKGLNPDNIKVEVMGYQDPVVTNDTQANRSINQRVEITIKSQLVQQLDYLRKHFKHVNIDHYKRFFSNVYLMDKENSNYVAQIYDSREKRQVLTSHFTIFVNEPFYADDGQIFTIASKPQPISEFNSDMKVFKLGEAKYNYVYKNITALTILNTNQEVKIGDYAIPTKMITPELPEQSFTMKKKITANVMEDVQNTTTLSSSFNNVIINKGKADGLVPGAEMFLYMPETRADGYPIPPKYLGYGFIYRLSDHYSIILIVNSLQEISGEAMATTRI